MNIDKAFPSKYLSAADLPDDGVTLTIHSVGMELIGEGSSADNKAIVHFVEDRLTGGKGMLLNRTNAKTITTLLGSRETDDWFGQKITIFPTQTEFKGESVPCIRVNVRTIAAKKGKIADSLKKSIGKNRGGELRVPRA